MNKNIKGIYIALSFASTAKKKYMDLILTNYEKMELQSIKIMIGIFLTSFSNLLLQAGQGNTLNEIVGYAGAAFLVFAGWFFRKMKVEIDIKASNKDKEND